MRKCSKIIDKPFLFVGLEIEELGVLILVFYYLSAFTYLYISFMFLCFSWVLILRIKKGKPQGALIHFFYKHGLPLEGLIRPVKNGKSLSIFPKK